MILRIKHLLCLLIVGVLVLSSCGEKAVDSVTASQFPASPDKIVVGVNGDEKELVPDDKACDDIVAQINERISKSGGFSQAALDTLDHDSGKHLSFELRDSEAFVEYIYNEGAPQMIDMLQPGGVVVAEEINVHRVFFSLTRDYHDCFFVGEDSDYVKSATFGPLVDNTALITYINDLIASESASAE